MCRQPDARKFEMSLDIAAPRDAVWKALTDADELMRWFPIDARVKPGAGGSLWISWGPPWEGDCPIRVWEPGRRLVIGWPWHGGTVAPGADGTIALPLSVDFELEGEKGRTRLRVVHSGFGPGAEWDQEFDGVSRGWAFELRGLRHYLEHHHSRNRRVIWARYPVVGFSEAAFERVIGPDAITFRGNIEGLREGDPYRVDYGNGERLEGQTALSIAGRSFAGSVSNLNNAFMRIEREACSGTEEIWAYISTYDLPANEYDRLETLIRENLRRAIESTRPASERMRALADQPAT